MTDDWESRAPVGPPAWDAAERGFVLSRRADVVAALKSAAVRSLDVAGEARRFSARLGGELDRLVRALDGACALLDGPAHADARGWMRGRVAAMQAGWSAERIDAEAVAIVDRLEAGPEIDAVTAIADALPGAVLAEALGIGRADLRRAARDAFGVVAAYRPLRSLAGYRAAEAAAAHCLAEIATWPGAVEARRGGGRAPSGAPADVEAYLLFFVVAGAHTTGALLGSALAFLAGRPDLQAGLAAEPRRIEPFVEECLRRFAPLRRLAPRVVTADLVLSGVDLPAGSGLAIDIEAAHHDPDAYPDPERFDIDRRGPPTLAFGTGAHACLGTALGRQEARAVLRRLVERYEVLPGASAAVRLKERDWRQFEKLPIILKRRKQMS